MITNVRKKCAIVALYDHPLMKNPCKMSIKNVHQIRIQRKMQKKIYMRKYIYIRKWKEKLTRLHYYIFSIVRKNKLFEVNHDNY